jgi:hypothetical protein
MVAEISIFKYLTRSRMVFSVPVNYATRFSGPVTALTARRVRYGV